MTNIASTTRPGQSGDFAALSDEDLFRLFQGGNEAAYNALVARYDAHIFGYLAKRMKDEERANDLKQDTFLRVHRAREKYDPNRKFSTWIFTIASNLLKNEYRNNARRRVSTFSDLASKRRDVSDDAPIEWESDGFSPEDYAYHRELRDAIRETIERLPPHHQEPLLLRDVQGLTYEEMAQTIGIELGTVKSRLNRARTAFKAAFPIPIAA